MLWKRRYREWEWSAHTRERCGMYLVSPHLKVGSFLFLLGVRVCVWVIVRALLAHNSTMAMYIVVVINGFSAVYLKWFFIAHKNCSMMWYNNFLQCLHLFYGQNEHTLLFRSLALGVFTRWLAFAKWHDGFRVSNKVNNNMYFVCASPLVHIHRYIAFYILMQYIKYERNKRRRRRKKNEY